MSALPPIADLHGGDGLHALCGIPSFASAAANARLYWSAGLVRWKRLQEPK